VYMVSEIREITQQERLGMGKVGSGVGAITKVTKGRPRLDEECGEEDGSEEEGLRGRTDTDTNCVRRLCRVTAGSCAA